MYTENYTKKRNTVIIADDEQLICELLKSLINWEELHLELIGEAYNGIALYQEILDKHPDIVVTDISMPQMDGIELIGKIRKEGIPCHFVIVSGYRQFEYAHNALKYDVEDYILKPVDAAELNAALKKLVQKTEDVRNLSKEKMASEEDKKLLKKFFINNGLQEINQRKLSLQDIEGEYGIQFEEGLFRMIYVKSDFLEWEEDYVEDSLSIQNKFFDTFQSAFGEECFCIVSDQKSDLLRIGINYPQENENRIQDILKEYFEHIRNFADLFKGYQLTIGVGNSYAEAYDLAKSGKEAEGAIGSRIVMGCDQILYWKNLNQPEIFLTEIEKKNFLREITREFELLEIVRFEESMRDLFRVVHERFSIVPLTDLLAEILETFLSVEQPQFAEQINEDYIRKQYIYGIHSAVSLMSLQRAVVRPIHEALEKIIDCVDRQNKKPVRTAYLYVEENYSKAIRLEDVAEQVELNPVYFSNVFKKETGQNFTDYLTDYRMKAAKELLQNTNDSINEIAEKVGYQDTRYFSKLFKKNIGIKPSEYRKIYG